MKEIKLQCLVLWNQKMVSGTSKIKTKLEKRFYQMLTPSE